MQSKFFSNLLNTMKGIICDGAGGPEVLKLAEVPEPTVRAGEVLIAVRATALNGADVMQRMGNYPPPPGRPPGSSLACTLNQLQIPLALLCTERQPTCGNVACLGI